MKRTALFLAALAFAAPALRADWVMKMKFEGSIQNGEATIRVKDTKTRADIGATLSTISDTASGEVATLMHDKKQIVKMNAADTKSLVDQIKALQPPEKAGAAPAKPATTGQKEKVGEWDAEIFTWKGALVEGRFWVAEKFPGWEKLGPAMDKLQLGGFGALAQGLIPKSADFPGMIVKQELTVLGNKLTSTLISVKEEAVDAKTFDLPTGYTAAENPLLNLQPPPAAK